MDGLSEKSIWRFYDDWEAAETGWWRAESLAEDARPVKMGVERIQVISARLYEVEAKDRANARALVLAGHAHRLKDTENSPVHMSKEEAEAALRELIGDPIPEKNSN